MAVFSDCENMVSLMLMMMMVVLMWMNAILVFTQPSVEEVWMHFWQLFQIFWPKDRQIVAVKFVRETWKMQ